MKTLNSHACQVAVERAYSSIARFYDNCKKSISGKKGYPRFKKNCRSVEYKTSGWSLSETRKQITLRTHACKCGLELDRDWNAGINILNLALSTLGHSGTWVLNPNASGDSTSTFAGAILLEQVESVNEESLH